MTIKQVGMQRRDFDLERGFASEQQCIEHILKIRNNSVIVKIIEILVLNTFV